MNRIRLRMMVSFFGLMTGGLLLVHGIKAVAIGLLNEENVLDLVLSVPDLTSIFFASVAGTAIWYFCTFRGKT